MQVPILGQEKEAAASARLNMNTIDNFTVGVFIFSTFAIIILVVIAISLSGSLSEKLKEGGDNLDEHRRN